MKSKNIWMAGLALLLAPSLHAQSFTLALTSCTPAPPAPTAAVTNADKSIVWAFLRTNDVWPCTITVPVAGTYTVSGSAASAWPQTTFHFESPKGTNIGTLTAPNTGSWNTYTPVSTKLTLPAGQIPLLLVLDISAVNLSDVLTFTFVPPPPPTQPDSITVSGKLLWCTICAPPPYSLTDPDIVPASGSLVVSQTGGAQSSSTIAADGSVAVVGTIDVAQDPLEFTIQLTDATGATLPGASMTWQFPKFELNSPTFLLKTVSLGMVRITHAVKINDTDCPGPAGCPAVRIVDWSNFTLGR